MSNNFGGKSVGRDEKPFDPRRQVNEQAWKNLDSGNYNDDLFAESESQPHLQYGSEPYGSAHARPSASKSAKENPYADNLRAAMGQQENQYLPVQQPMRPTPPSALALQGAYGVYQPPKSKIAAALLALFTGGIGAHNFYLGYYGRGSIQLGLMFVGLVMSLMFIGIPLVGAMLLWGFVDFILIVTDSSYFNFDAKGRPLE